MITKDNAILNGRGVKEICEGIGREGTFENKRRQENIRKHRRYGRENSLF